MSKDIFTSLNLHGNTLTGAVVQTPTSDNDVVNKKYVDDMMIESGNDGFIEGKFNIVSVFVKNYGTEESVIHMNKGWKIFVIVSVDNGSRDSHTINGYIRFDDNDINFTREAYDSIQAKSVYGIKLLENQLLYTFDTNIFEGDTTKILLENIDSVNFICSFPFKEIIFNGRTVEHQSITLAESTSVIVDIDYYPVIAKHGNDYIPTLEDKNITTPYISDTILSSNISETINETYLNDSHPNYLVFIPTNTGRRYWCIIVDENDNPISSKTYIKQDLRYVFRWLGVEYSQTLIDLGYIPYTESSRFIIGFDKE